MPGRLRNEDQIIEHARRLARRITEVRAAGDAPIVIGGDCSLLIGAGLALCPAGRFGLAHLDGRYARSLTDVLVQGLGKLGQGC